MGINDYSVSSSLILPARSGGYAVGDVLRYTLETRALIHQGSMRPDRKDLRVYFSGSEIPRILTDTAAILFRVQEAVSASATGSGYVLYYGYAAETGSPLSDPRDVWSSYYDGNDISSLTVVGVAVSSTVPKPEFLKIGSNPTLVRTSGTYDWVNIRDVDGMLWNESDQKFYTWYDADDNGQYDGRVAWNSYLATSPDLLNWTKLGSALEPGGGPSGSQDNVVATSMIPHLFTVSGTASYYVTYLGSNNATFGIPAVPYILHGATGSSLTGPWTKTGILLPLGGTGEFDSIYNVDAVIYTFDGGTTYEMYYGAAYEGTSTGWATASHPLGPWVKQGNLYAQTEYTENPRVLYDSGSGYYYLIANHIGRKVSEFDHTVSNVMYWSTDRHVWDINNQTTITEPEYGKWDAMTIGMASTPVFMSGVVFMLYDGGDYSGFSQPNTFGHKFRDVGAMESQWPFPFGKVVSISGAGSVTTPDILTGDGNIKVRAKFAPGGNLTVTGTSANVQITLGEWQYDEFSPIEDQVTVNSIGTEYVRALGHTKTYEFARSGTTMYVRCSGYPIWSGSVSTSSLKLKASDAMVVESITVEPWAVFDVEASASLVFTGSVNFTSSFSFFAESADVQQVSQNPLFGSSFLAGPYEFSGPDQDYILTSLQFGQTQEADYQGVWGDALLLSQTFGFQASQQYYGINEFGSGSFQIGFGLVSSHTYTPSPGAPVDMVTGVSLGSPPDLPKWAKEQITLETIDRAIRDWFDKTVNVRVMDQNGVLRKVPVQFSSGERWATRSAFRDENGVLILPIIAIRRTSIDPDPTRMALGCQTEFIQVARLVDPKSNDIKNLERGKPPGQRRDYPPIYDVYTIPFPDRMIASYQLIIQAQFISQMNEILQKIWRSLDIQKSFVAPFENDGRRPPRLNQYGNANPYQLPRPLGLPYVVGFLEETSGDTGNFEEFTDQERIVKYTTMVKVPCVLQTSPEGEQPMVQVQRTAYKLVLKAEAVRTADSMEDLDDIFGTLK